MKRYHWFEWGDQRWLPNCWRLGLLKQIRDDAEELYRPLSQEIAELLRSTTLRSVIDLGSGLGGPWAQLKTDLQHLLDGRLEILFTDLTLPASSLKNYHPRSVDFCGEDFEQNSLRTLFSGFHHLKPLEAESLLHRFAQRQHPVVIAEFTRRCPSHIWGMLLSPLRLWFGPQPRDQTRWERFWTFFIPVIPLLYTWDGIVSHWRTYTIDEYSTMLRQVRTQTPDYEWHFRELDTSSPGMRLSLLIGRPCPANEVQ